MSLQGNMARTAIEGLETKTAEMEALAARLEAEVARLRAQAPDAEVLARVRREYTCSYSLWGHSPSTAIHRLLTAVGDLLALYEEPAEAAPAEEPAAEEPPTPGIANEVPPGPACAGTGVRLGCPDEERLMTRAQWWELMCAVDADEEPVTFLALNAVGEPQAYSCPPRLSLGLTPAEGASELLAALTRSAREVVLAQIAWAKRQEERERRAAEDDAQASIGGGDNAHG